jgi:hypothetical protein
MIINFKEETADGSVEFAGELKKEEVDFLLRYALLTLLSRGLLPTAVVAKFDNDDDDPPIDKGQLN